MIPLVAGRHVFVKEEGNGLKKSAEVSEICDRSRSYKLDLDNGKKIQINRVHIHHAPEDIEYKTNVNYSVDIPQMSKRRSESILTKNSAEVDKEDVGDDFKDSQLSECSVSETGPTGDKLCPRRTIKPPQYLKDYITSFKGS